MLNTAAVSADKTAAATGLRTAVTILDKWGATGEQGEAILRVSHSTYARAKRKDGLQSISLDRDQLTRLSFVLNIHAALRTIFDNPDNLYGFMRMPNDNGFFFGRSPLEVMGSGDMVAVYETFKRIDVLRGSRW
ncbi:MULTISPECIES: antitoxin Xre-like helix-turn-helix domain-containing protein [Pseudomonas]|uniref:antitoxin Xre-like helix-turn-helix domain-containing protein n=1 Tax=Pseudomonas TaxID=286 RepID=UPI00123C3CD1|nr:MULTISPECIES: antitoxin Xre-like helix-turn-helix domain-containing protein [Pseudomonas]QIB52264.1 DUF2384 domain-containing protein [Pseudomonas sp. OIL-1]